MSSTVIANSRTRWFVHVLGTAIALAVLLMAGGGAYAAGGPTVSTDRHHYHSGDTVVITGSGFDAGAELTVLVTDSGGAVDFSAGVSADGDGAFEVNYVFTGSHGEYTVAVLDADGNVLASASFDGGTHFRYGHIFWEPGAGPNEIVFTFQAAFRRSGYGAPGVGSIITETVGGTNLCFGDGTCTGTLRFLVTSIDPANDWLFGVALHPGTNDPGVRRTYAAAGDYTAFSATCCRISFTAAPNGHINNPDGFYRIETLVNVGTGDSSAVSVMPPVVLCPIDGLCTFNVPATDPDGDDLHWRLSTDVEASGFAGGFTQPGPPHATNAAAIDPDTGVYSWDTTGATLHLSQPNTLYSTQVTIESRDAAGDVKNKVAVDFLIQLVAVVGAPPVFDSPPTPACGSTIPATVGSLVTFTVQASDPDAGDTVTLNAVGLPGGATMTPGLPTSGNPVSSDFSWTPAGPQTVVMTFTATDQTGQSALCNITIRVEEVREITVPFDIRPTSCPNPLTLRERGVLPAAILGTMGFDVTDVDPSTVLLEGVPALRWDIEDVAAPYDGPFTGDDPMHCTTDGPDGFMDLTLKFDAQAIIAAVQANHGPVSRGDVVILTLTGELWDGTPITGMDVVRIN